MEKLMLLLLVTVTSLFTALCHPQSALNEDDQARSYILPIHNARPIAQNGIPETGMFHRMFLTAMKTGSDLIRELHYRVTYSQDFDSDDDHDKDLESDTETVSSTESTEWSGHLKTFMESLMNIPDEVPIPRKVFIAAVRAVVNDGKIKSDNYLLLEKYGKIVYRAHKNVKDLEKALRVIYLGHELLREDFDYGKMKWSASNIEHFVILAKDAIEGIRKFHFAGSRTGHTYRDMLQILAFIKKSASGPNDSNTIWDFVTIIEQLFRDACRTFIDDLNQICDEEDDAVESDYPAGLKLDRREKLSLKQNMFTFWKKDDIEDIDILTAMDVVSSTYFRISFLTRSLFKNIFQELLEYSLMEEFLEKYVPRNNRTRHENPLEDRFLILKRSSTSSPGLIFRGQYQNLQRQLPTAKKFLEFLHNFSKANFHKIYDRSLDIVRKHFNDKNLPDQLLLDIFGESGFWEQYLFAETLFMENLVFKYDKITRFDEIVVLNYNFHNREHQFKRQSISNPTIASSIEAKIINDMLEKHFKENFNICIDDWKDSIPLGDIFSLSNLPEIEHFYNAIMEYFRDKSSGFWHQRGTCKQKIKLD